MRLIDLDALMKFPIRIDHYDNENGNEHFIFGIETVMEYAENLPTIEAEHVKHGRWAPALHVGDCCYRCSECQFLRDAYLLDIGNYCPNCGAKMDGE